MLRVPSRLVSRPACFPHVNHRWLQPQMAIATKAKAFVASPIVQSIVNDMYTGRIFFTITANRSIVADNYKQRAIEVYDVRKAPFLDHYRSLLFC